MVERNLDLFSAIQGRPKNGALMQGCPFGVADSDWGFQGSVADSSCSAGIDIGPGASRAGSSASGSCLIRCFL